MGGKPNWIGAFSHVPKTGGLQVARILQEHHGARHLAVEARSGHIYSAGDLSHDLRIHRHVVSLTGHGLRPHVDYGEAGHRLRWYTVLRQPADRFLSHFMHEVVHGKKPNDLARWMAETPRSNFQVRMLAGGEDLEAAIALLDKMAVVGLTEQLPTSLRMIRAALDWPNLPCSRPGKVNASSDTMRANTMAAALEHLDEITAANKLDSALYEYAAGTLWPRQLEALIDENVEDPGSKLAKMTHRATYLGYRRLVHLPLTRAQGRLARVSP